MTLEVNLRDEAGGDLMTYESPDIQLIGKVSDLTEVFGTLVNGSVVDYKDVEFSSIDD